MRHHRLGATAAAVAALALGASACGSSSSNASGSSSATTAASSGSATTAGSGGSSGNGPTADNAQGESIAQGVQKNAQLAGKVTGLVHSGTLTIGAQLQQPPDDYYAADGKTAIGFEVNLAHAIGNELGVKISYLPEAFDSLITSLQAGRVDITMSAMNDTVTREKTISFVDYLTDGIGLLVKAGNPQNIKAPTDLCGKSVTVVSGTTQQAYAQQLSKTCTSQGKSAVNIVVSSSTAQETESLATGRVAAVLNDNITDAYDQATKPDLFTSVDYAPIEPGPYGIGVRKSDTQLLNTIQSAVQNLMDDGTYGKILKAWNLSSVALTQATVNHGIPG